MGARYHDPAYGRFSQADYWEPGFLTPQAFTPLQYGYVMNNPLVFTDPTGHFCWGCLERAVVASLDIGLGAVGASAGVLWIGVGIATLNPVFIVGGATLAAAGVGLMMCGVDVARGQMCYGQPPNRPPVRPR